MVAEPAPRPSAAPHDAVTVDDLLARTDEYLPPDRRTLVSRAYEFAAREHEGQTRQSGEPFIQHPLHVALVVAGLQQDASSIAAALLHDVQEDCGVTQEQLAEEFGDEVARMVEGLTKLDKLQLQTEGRNAIQAENLRKMFLAMAEDLRVVIVKLADRLHNMRTLEAKKAESRQRIAQETMDIYAPLASRLGIWQMKWELEDLAFRHLQPDAYRQIARLLQSKRTTREKYIGEVEEALATEFERHGIRAEISGRAKHIYSIHQKIQKYSAQGKSFNEIYDLLAVRVIVPTVGECYQALGAVHQLWHPIPGQFDDYIASPKDSMYQSLHTTVLTPGGHPLEVQIRSHEMHHLAEYGVAAHWRYKEGTKRDRRNEERLAWLRQLLEWQRDLAGAEEFVDAVKTDIFRDQVFVYTPKGDIKDMPAGATPLDFAYRIHTDLGHRCVGSKVNGRLVALNTGLQNGDVVEILTSRNSRGPSRDWLNSNLGYVKTGHSREKIRQWFRKQERAENIEKGREMLEKELRRLALDLSKMQDRILELFSYSDMDSLLAAIGFGEISTHQVAVRIAGLLRQDEEPDYSNWEGRPTRQVGNGAAVQVLGTGDVLTQIARCCNPVPGDPITGFVTRSRGVSIHRADCHAVLNSQEPERLIEVEWGSTGRLYPVGVRIEAWDRVGLLRDVTTMIAEEKVNMLAVRTVDHDDRTVTVQATLETTGIEQLSRLFSRLETIRGVRLVARAVEARA
jgi:GTP pyrophosphokinase